MKSGKQINRLVLRNDCSTVWVHNYSEKLPEILRCPCASVAPDEAAEQRDLWMHPRGWKSTWCPSGKAPRLSISQKIWLSPHLLFLCHRYQHQ